MRGYRLRQIEQYVLERDTVSLEELGRVFQISINTVRRDVAELLKLGTIDKIYGGVCARRQNPLVPFEQRHGSHMDWKTVIGREAARFLENGDIVYIDSGTTTPKLFDNLPEDISLTVITGSLNVILEAMAYPGINVISTAGQLDRKTRSFVGANTNDALGRFNVKKAFMAATGISLTSGVTNSSLLEYEIKARAVQRAEQSFLLIDSRKLGVSALTTYAQIQDFSCIVTDQAPPEEYRDFLESHGVRLVCGGPPEGDAALFLKWASEYKGE